MPISHQYKCLFVHIPKTGGTSIESALDIFGDWKIENKELLFGQIQSQSTKRLGYKTQFLQHLTYNQCQEVTDINDEYLSFSFVRNPWDKMVSIYSNIDNNLIEMSSQLGIDIQSLSFSDFIKTTVKLDHIHLEEQCKFICNNKGELLVDYVGRFESLHQDFEKLCLLLNLTVKLPHKNFSKRSSYRMYYTEETKKIIRERYHRDIELFNYIF